MENKSSATIRGEIVSGNIPNNAADTSGTAATATTLATARNINGVSFNGSANITVTAAAGTLSGNTLKSTVLASSLTSVGILSALDILGDLEVGNDIKFGTTDAAPQHILDAQDDQIITITDGGLTKLIAAGNLDIGAHTFRASTFYADVATGTAPFTVTSTTPVANLQAATATILHTARNIAGVSFNGSANISLNNNAITNGAGYTTNTGTLTGNGATNRVPIYNGTTSFTTDSGFTYGSNILSTEKLNITAIAATTSENTTIMIDGDGQTLTRELGSNAYNSTTIGTNTGALTVSTGLDLNSGTTFNGSAARTISVDVSDFMTNGANNRIVTATGTDAMNGEANLTFDGTSLIVAGQRPVKITSSTISIQGQPNSAWATAYLFLGSGTTNRGGYGALGSSDTLTYYYIGDAYNDNTMHIQPNAGNVGIGMSGTTAPAHKLEVNGNVKADYALLGRGFRTANRGELHLNATGTNDVAEMFFGYGEGFTEGNIRWGISDRGTTSGALIFYRGPANGGFSESLTLLDNFNVGIANNAPASRLHVTDAVNRNMNSSGTGQFQISGNGYQFAVAIGSTTCALYHNSSARTLSLGTNETARLTIAGNSGNTTCTGTITATDFFTGDNGKIGADATDHITFINNSRADIYINNSLEFRFEADGDFHADGDVVAQSTSVSDSRLKDNIIPISGALDKIKSLRGVSYTWNSGKKKGKQDIGLIAQEVEQVIPEIVKDKKLPLMDGTDPNETYKTIDYEKIIAVLVEAVKDQQKQIDNLEKQIKK